MVAMENPPITQPIPPSTSSTKGTPSKNAPHREKKAPTKHRSVAAVQPMDGAKMSELATLKLKQMDSVTKKMKAKYKEAQEQIQKDKAEILQIDETLKSLHLVYDPLIKAYSSRKLQAAKIKEEFKKAKDTMAVMMESQKMQMRKIKSKNVKSDKEDARQRLKAARGYGTGRESTYTNAQMLEDSHQKWKAEITKAVPEDLSKNLKSKVKMSSHMKIETSDIPMTKKK
ncbi:hypothetical protein TrST_g7750 [Triparma strigata]|uniref:Uncharacterized protein n=1 Tax=Triparma strigata TaxID=1606541 RepID=A0A9W7BQZ0_9STRA|nr:hypothetical protein TrST_g7750 [Triparma strigata]